MSSVLPDPSTPTPSTSSFASTPRTPSTPATSSARRIDSTHFRYSTPPSSPPPPVTPSSVSCRSTSRKTLHLISPSKPLSANTNAARSPALTPRSSSRSLLTIKGNVTPSRASAFFAPRKRARVARGIDSSPSASTSPRHTQCSPSSLGNTSARRGTKRFRDARRQTPSNTPSQGKQRSDRIILDVPMHSRPTAPRQLSGEPLFMMSDSESDSDADLDIHDFMYGSDEERSPPLARLNRAPSPSLPAYRTPARPTAALPSLSGSVSPSPYKPVPMAMRSLHADSIALPTALASMRCGSGGGLSALASSSLSRRISQTSYLSTFTSHQPAAVYRIASDDSDGIASTQPLCAAYSWSAKSYSATRQWLAVGDNEGKLSLVDTARDPTLASFDTNDLYDDSHTATENRPSWQASTGSLFSTAWRFDDRCIATSGSDYQVKVFDTSTAQLVNAFSGSKGSARRIAWDPASSGQLLASAGRDGAVHIWDLRMSDGKPCQATDALPEGDCIEEEDREPLPPLLSLWSAHSSLMPSHTPRSRSSKSRLAPRGVTSLIYHPHREHCIFTAGCADASVRSWDLRFAIKARGAREACPPQGASITDSRPPLRDVSNRSDEQMDLSLPIAGSKRKSRKPRRARPGEASFVLNNNSRDDCDEQFGENSHAEEESDPVPIAPYSQTDDLSLSLGKGWNKRSHGISSLCIAGGHQQKMYAACTDGRIYRVPLSSLEPGETTNCDASLEPPLFHPAQMGNTLHNHLSLCPDDRTMAMGCNNGSVLLWDTEVGRASVLGGGNGGGTASRHSVHCEINALDWCYDASYAGWRLATASDDCTVRIWEADRGLSTLSL